MLKQTKVEIALLTDIDMLLFVERGIRGGISQCSKRHAKANNKHLNSFNPDEESTYLMYLDANNLYGYSMMQPLPLNGFEWLDYDHIDQMKSEHIMATSADSPVGYMFEVDLSYPTELHNKHKDYPLCAESSIVPGSKHDKKLLLTLYDKKNYVIHYRMLQCALKQGLVLTKIHRGVKFNQTTWLKPYIELNTSLRMVATNEFEKNFYKLLNNSTFGKTIENQRGRVEIYVRQKYDKRYGVSKLISRPNFKRITIFDENLVAVHMYPTKITMNKPIAVGMSVLELSKVLMYDFHYDRMKPKYGEDIELMYTGR